MGLRAVGAVLAALFAAPLGYLIVRGAADAPEILGLWTSGATLRPLGRTLWLAATTSLSAALLGTALAWVIGRTDLPGRRMWRVLLPLPLVIPSFIGAFTLIAAFAPGGLLPTLLAPLGLSSFPRIRGFWGSFAVLTLLTYPYVYLPVVARLRQLPHSLEESARLLGHSPWRTFRTAVLPQARGAVLAGGLLVFLYGVSEFGVVQLMRYDTLTRIIYSSRIYDPTAALSMSLLLGLLAVVVVAGERSASRGLRPLEAARGSRTLLVPLGRWRVAALGLVGATVTFALAAPLGVMTYWAVRGVLRGSTRPGSLVGDLTGLAQPAWNTALVSVTAAAVAMVVVLPVAFLTVRHRGRTAGTANALVVAGFALPGLVIALALVHWTLQAAPAWLGGIVYQTRGLLVAAYVLHFSAQSLRAAQVGVATMPRRVDDAARMLGANRARRLLAVDLPLMLPTLLAGGGLVLLSSMKELPATLLLAPPGFHTLATKVWAATEEAFLADASIAALVLVALSGILTWLLVIRQADASE